MEVLRAWLQRKEANYEHEYLLRTNLARAEIMLGNYEPAIEQCLAAREMNDRFLPTYLNHAQALKAQGNYSGAVNLLSEAAEIFSTDPEVYLSLGSALRSDGVGRFAEAEQAFREGLRLARKQDDAEMQEILLTHLRELERATTRYAGAAPSVPGGAEATGDGTAVP